MRLFACLAVFLSLTFAAPLIADTVITTTGRVEGKILEETQDHVKVQTSPGVVVTVKRADVKEIIKGTAAPEAERPKVSAANSLFVLKDGTRIAGSLQFSSVTVSTDFGVLRVPVSDVKRIRVGKKCDAELIDRIADLIEKLGSSDFKVREQATEDLIKLGPVAASELKAAARSADVEIKTRAEKILASFIGREEETVPDDDVVETVKFTIVGTVDIQTFDLMTAYGRLTVKKQDVVEVVVSARTELTRVVTITPITGFMETKVSVSAGDNIVIKASGIISYGPGGFTFSPDGAGSEMLPPTDEGFSWGTLLGRIGASGKVFKVGLGYEGTADRSGELQLKVAAPGLDPSEFIGEYKVEITVAGKK